MDASRLRSALPGADLGGGGAAPRGSRGDQGGRGGAARTPFRHGSHLDVHLDGVDDVEAAIRSAAVNARVPSLAALPALRAWVNARQRGAIAEFGALVIDGRDIGTVVAPDAPLKIFLTATAAERARRRLLQRDGAVDPLLLAAETARLEERDRIDGARAAAPLRQAGDAVALDTTGMTFDAQVRRIVALAGERGLAAG